MFNNQKELVINTSNVKDIKPTETILDNKLNIYNNLYNKNNKNLITISIIINDDNIDKLKICTSSIIETTIHLEYILLFVISCTIKDTQEIKDFINSIKEVSVLDKKLVVLENNNKNNNFGYFLALNNTHTRYNAIIDLSTVVTHRWLDNMLECAEYNPKIGIISSINEVEFINQNDNINFDNVDSIDTLKEKAKEFNNNNNISKWEESLYIKYSNIILVKKEIIDDIGFIDIGISDSILNIFGEYIKRAINIGYSNYICNSTFFLSLKADDIGFTDITDKDFKGFKNRYNLDFNSEYVYQDEVLVNLLYLTDNDENKKNKNKNKIKNNNKLKPMILGIDIMGGASILGIKNYIRATSSINNFDITAFTTDPKYFNNLNILSENNAIYGDIDDINISDINSFDYIILGNPINYYYNGLELLEKIIKLGKKGCKILVKLENNMNYYSMLKIFNINNNISISDNINNNNNYFVSYDEFVEKIQRLNISKCDVDYNFGVDDETAIGLVSQIKGVSGTTMEDNLINSCLIQEYCFCLVK